MSQGSCPSDLLPAVETLLPLRILVVSLELIEPIKPRFFHQAGINAFVRYLLDSPTEFENLLVIDTPESGRVHYRAGDHYRFSVVALSGSQALLGRLIQQLNNLPFSANHTDPRSPFRNNWRLLALQDAFSEQSVSGVEDLGEYTSITLQQEAQQWAGRSVFYWHWLSPARLLKHKKVREDVKGEARFCRNAGDINADLLLSRLYDALAEILRRRGVDNVQPRPAPPVLQLRQQHLFWLDSEYSSREGEEKIMGGMLGFLGWKVPDDFDARWWNLIVLGQYIGIGQRRVFGWGRYELVTEDGGVTYRRGLPASPILNQVISDENLLTAYRHVSDKQTQSSSSVFHNDDTSEDLEELEEEIIDSSAYEEVEHPIDDDVTLERLHRLAGKLVNGQYQVPSLQAYSKTKPDGTQRILAVAPFWDRVLQRAVAQVLTPALEEIMYGRSHGYRPGRSRITAKEAIQRAWREGYHWVFESDIEDFFASVNLQILAERLRSLFYDDPIVEMIMAWLSAPVESRNTSLSYNGLPLGSPLSPLMANLLLDDFDSDMQTAGFRLIRFADDFLVMCKNPEQAQKAAEMAQSSLSEHGLSLNPEKTRIKKAEQGFRYLGYLFVNDMALDVGGKQQQETLNNAAWMHTLNQRDYKKVDNETEALPKTLTQSTDHQFRIGERQNQGTFLCITGHSVMVSTKNGRLQAERDDELLVDVPWQGLQTVLLIGPHHITTPALRAALKHETPIHFASAQGYYQGTTWSGKPGAAGCNLWLLQQQRATTPEAALYIAQQLTQARIEQQAETLRQRDFAEHKEIKALLNLLPQATDLAKLNGVEGQAAKLYFAAIAKCLPDEWGFRGRFRRPPPDPFNLLLSLGYSVLYAHTDSILRADGLLPWQGFYHQPHGRHAALASDLMEPFRHIIERVALTQVSRKSFTPGDFTLTETGECYINAEAKRRYLATIQQRFETETQSRGSDHKEKVYQQLHRQNLSLIRWLQGDADFEVWRSR